MKEVNSQKNLETKPMVLVTSYSPRTDQSFFKELAKPTQEKLFLKNFPALQKNQKRNAQPDTDR
ncbi:MAG: hypothetical protein ABIK31_05680 [candidate division WOR-3 bacterium]